MNESATRAHVSLGEPRTASVKSAAERAGQVPLEEQNRIRALERYHVFGTPPEEMFKGIAHTARTALAAPLALVTFVREDQQWIKASAGIDLPAPGLNFDICAYVVRSCGPLVIPDARQDPRFANNPIVTAENGVRFYVGVPLQAPDGHALGTLCVIDTQPRARPGPEAVTLLQNLASSLVAAMEYRRSDLEARASLEHRRALNAKQNHLLALAAQGAPLATVLEEIVRFVEDLSPDVRASVLLVDETGERLVHGAAVRLPDAYVHALDGLGMNPNTGPCATAAFTRDFVEVADVTTDPLWVSFRDVALPHGLRACWSMPILSTDDQVLGTFAMYYTEPRLATTEERNLIRTAADLAFVAIERHKKEAELRRARERLSFLLEATPATVFACEPVPPHRTTFISPNVEKLLGYSPEEFLADPGFWASKLHPEDAEAVLNVVAKERESCAYEYRLLDAQGKYRWLRDELRGVLSQQGEVTELVGYFQDITREREAQEQVARADQRAVREYEQLLDRVKGLAGQVGIASGLPDMFRALFEFVEASTPDLAGLVVARYEPEEQQRTCLYTAGYSFGRLHEIDVSSLRPLPLNQSPQSRAIRTGEAVIENDYLRYTRANPSVALGQDEDVLPLRSSIAVPLKISGVTIGALEAQSTRENAYNESHVTALSMAGHLAAIAVRNRELFSKQQEISEAYKALALFGQTIEAVHDIDELVKHGLLSLLAQLDLDLGLFYEITPQGLLPRRVEGHVPPLLAETFKQVFPPEPGTFGHVLRTGKPLLLRNYHTFENPVPAVLKAGVTSTLTLPVKLRGVTRFILGFATLHREANVSEDATAIAMAFVRRLENALERVEYHSEIKATREATFRALGLALEHRDLETKGHTDRVVQLSRGFAQEMRLSPKEMQALRWGAYLHDLGKIGIPDAILLKPGKLTTEEFERIKEHPLNGIAMCRDIPFLPAGTRQVVRNHHERWDGTGYPDALAGNEIPLLARMFALVDVYDALTSERPYKEAWTHEQAVQEIEQQSGKQFDPQLVPEFLRALKQT